MYYVYDDEVLMVIGRHKQTYIIVIDMVMVMGYAIPMGMAMPMAICLCLRLCLCYDHAMAEQSGYFWHNK